MEQLSDREKFFFMMAFDLGVNLGESGKIDKIRENELRRSRETDTALHLEFAKRFLEGEDFSDYAKIFANVTGYDFFIKNGYLK